MCCLSFITNGGCAASAWYAKGDHCQSYCFGDAEDLIEAYARRYYDEKVRYGKESILTSFLPSGVGAGSAKYKRYRALLLKINDDGKVLWRRTYGSRDKDYEAQCLAVTPDGYLVGGCSEGYASPNGVRIGKRSF